MADSKYVSDPELLWLREMHRLSLAGEEADPIVVRAALWDDLPNDFDPERIHESLLRNGELTLLGIWVADRESPVIKLVECIIYAIKAHLKNEPQHREFTAVDLAEELDAEATSVERAFFRLSDIGSYWSTALAGESEKAHSAIRIEKEYIYREYRNFTGINEKISANIETRLDIGNNSYMDNTWIHPSADDAYKQILDIARLTLEKQGFSRSAEEMKLAIENLSKTPEPNLTGAVRHAVGALEAVAREVTGDRKVTLGKIAARHPETFPGQLSQVVSKIWGYSSEFARHVREDRELHWEESQLVVGLSAALVTYLAQKDVPDST
jgi:hypothetical protein